MREDSPVSNRPFQFCVRGLQASTHNAARDRGALRSRRFCSSPAPTALVLKSVPFPFAACAELHGLTSNSHHRDVVESGGTLAKRRDVLQAAREQFVRRERSAPCCHIDQS